MTVHARNAHHHPQQRGGGIVIGFRLLPRIPKADTGAGLLSYPGKGAVTAHPIALSLMAPQFACSDPGTYRYAGATRR